jgi:glycerophosphoryl diester phosphodiesterase
MRLLPLSVLACVLAACVPLPATLDPIAAQRERWLAADAPQVLVVGHRGCWRDAPENSIASLEACIALGVDMVEVDVRRTRDGALVVMHDETVDRTTDGVGAIADLSLEDVRALRLRSGAGGPEAPLTAHSVPTFEEFMIAARGRILVNLDAKADIYNEAFTVLERTSTADHILMKRRVTENDPALASVAPFDRVLAMPILDQTAGPPAPLLQRQDHPATRAVELIFTDLDYLAQAAPLIEGMRARVWVNTLRPQFSAGLVDAGALTDPNSVWGALIELGVDTIQTDEPEALIAYLQRGDLR